MRGLRFPTTLGRLRSVRRLSLALLAITGILGAVAAAPALAEAPWWQINSETAPTNLPPGGEGNVLVVVSNLGDAPIDGTKDPVVVTDKLPAGLVATAIAGPIKNGIPLECTLATLKCSFTGILNSYEQIAVAIKVKVEEPQGTVTSLPDEASVEGGGAAKVSRTLSVPVNAAPASFGISGYELAPLNEDGTPATQAGVHPFQLTTTLVLNETAANDPVKPRYPVDLPKDLSFGLPPGLVGNPNAAAQCTMANFFALVFETNLCPPSSVVGVATVTTHEPKFGIITKTVPVFNLVPSRGEPAKFGFDVIGKVPIVIDTSVRSGHDYGVVASVKDATETAGLLSSQVTFWGVPGDPRHNNARGWECVAGGAFHNQVGKPCPTEAKLPEEPFLTLPTSCAANPAAEPVISTTEADSWANPGVFLGAESAWITSDDQPLGFEGCGVLPFTPSITVVPEQHSASTPTGLSVDVKVPQKSTLEAGALAEADVRDTRVTLPQGVQLSPSAANGLQACSEAQIGFEGFNATAQINEFSTGDVSCPDASKVGTVKIKTPLLTHELEGDVYLATPAPNGEGGKNPFNSLVALYLVAKDPVSGVLVKLAGEGHVDEGTLRVSTTFKNTPQVPFEDLKIKLFGGPRASVTTPPLCGNYATDAAFEPWSGTGVVNVLGPPEEFNISSGVGGSGCPGSVPFNPGFTAYTTNPQAGAFTGFQLELTRPDGNQALQGLSMHLPPGIAAMLSSVTLCSDAQAAASACPPDSEVGHATAVAGLGSEPYVQEGGRVFITGPYGNAPFGLEIVTPAVAGPFDLGLVTVRSKLFIDPNNASVMIVSDPLPTQLKGIPLQLKRVIATVDRPNFQFNPTSCAPMSIDGSISGAEGATQPVSSPFQVGNCSALPFSPKLTASAAGAASKANGTSFAVKLESAGLGQANIAKVSLALPKELPSRLTTLQKACVAAVFEANPASCPPESVIGQASIHTPVLRNPLSGPAYLVSHANAGFPDVEFVLQGEGVMLVLDGKTDIKKGITYSRFESAPDAPFTTFETTLPAGPHSALTANVPETAKFSLCGQSLQMPTEITAQNGALIKQATKIAVTGCATVRANKAKRLTRAQKLKRALKACRKKFKAKRLHAKRASCEKQARKRYGAKRHGHKGKKTAAHHKG
jgi:hypothetical protein